jgi:sortase (surface protein transpeptidase)
VLAGLLALRAPGSTGLTEAASRTEAASIRLLPAPETSAAPASETLQRKRAAAKERKPGQKPDPVRIVIPAIGVSAPVIPLGLNGDKTLELPQNFSHTGWWTGGPEPGERGPAVIVGHVDSRRGPAVFHRLRALRPGDRITVVLKDRSRVRFVVRSMKAFPKDRFPTKLVYGKTKQPTLRLVTCDGRFDRSSGHYVDNYIVFATIAAGR